jgi:hypothetical protein
MYNIQHIQHRRLASKMMLYIENSTLKSTKWIGAAVTGQTYTWDILRWNLGRVSFSWDFSWLSSAPKGKYLEATSIRSQPLPSQVVPTHHPRITPFDVSSSYWRGRTMTRKNTVEMQDTRSASRRRDHTHQTDLARSEQGPAINVTLAQRQLCYSSVVVWPHCTICCDNCVTSDSQVQVKYAHLHQCRREGKEAGTNYLGPAVCKGARGSIKLYKFLSLLGSITVSWLYKLTPSGKAQVTLPLRVFQIQCQDFLAGAPMPEGPKTFSHGGPNPLSAVLIFTSISLFPQYSQRT